MPQHRVVVVRWFVDMIPDTKHQQAPFKRWTIIGRDEQDEEQIGYTFSPWVASLADQSKKLGEWIDLSTTETRWGWKIVTLTMVPFAEKQREAVS